MEIHPSQRRLSCELCRKNKAKCQRIHPDDLKCVRCTLANVLCDSGQQRKVGRPKRQEAASSSAVKNPPTTKRHRHIANSKSRSIATKRSRGHEASIPSYTPQDVVLHRYPGVQSMSSTSIPTTSDQDWLGWPTFMTDGWHHKVLPRADTGRIITNSEPDAPADADCIQPTVHALRNTSTKTIYDPPPTLRSATDHADLLSSSMSWSNPGLRVNNGSSSNYRRVENKNSLPFGIGKRPAYYVHENKFSTDVGDIALSDVGAIGSEAMAKLLRIACGLQLRSTIVQSHRSKIDLGLLIHREGLFFIEGYALTEYAMASAQELVQTVTTLMKNPRTAHKPDDQLLACLISTTLDVYTRLLSFFELFLEHLTARTEGMGADAIMPIPGLVYNNTVVKGLCAQGTLFTSTVFHLLGRMEGVLGIGSTQGKGLLSTDQIESLYNILDESEDLTRETGIMRPADMKSLYAQISTILGQIALNE